MVTTLESQLTKPEVYEIRQIQLSSPMLHIGSSVSQLNPFEYVQTGKFVYLPNKEALAKALKERGHLNEFIQRIETKQEITTLLEDAFGEDWQSVKNEKGQSIFPKAQRILKWTDQKITDLRPMIRNGFGQLYIPGSSIKGAIRTAIAYHLLKHSQQYNLPKEQRVSEVERRLRESMGNLKQKAKFIDDQLFMNRLFCDFELAYQERRVSGKTSLPNTDFMRAVHITDTKPLLEEKLEQRGQTIYRNLPVAAEVIVSSHSLDRRAKWRASIYTEILRNIKSQFVISLDLKMLSWFHRQDMKIPFQSIEEILKICQEFAQDQWDYEHDYWLDIQDNPNSLGKKLLFGEIRKIYDPEQCPYTLRVGWASGMLGTTINLLFKDDLREEIRDICGFKAPGFEAPKSRRTVVNLQGETQYVLGWTKLKALES